MDEWLDGIVFVGLCNVYRFCVDYERADMLANLRAAIAAKHAEILGEAAKEQAIKRNELHARLAAGHELIESLAEALKAVKESSLSSTVRSIRLIAADALTELGIDEPVTRPSTPDFRPSPGRAYE